MGFSRITMIKICPNGDSYPIDPLIPSLSEKVLKVSETPEIIPHPSCFSFTDQYHQFPKLFEGSIIFRNPLYLLEAKIVLLCIFRWSNFHLLDVGRLQQPQKKCLLRKTSLQKTCSLGLGSIVLFLEYIPMCCIYIYMIWSPIFGGYMWFH